MADRDDEFTFFQDIYIRIETRVDISVVGNGPTWDRFEPGTKKIKKKKLKNFEFCPRFKFVLDSLHFPLL